MWVAAAEGGVVMRSVDDGVSWSTVSNEVDTDWYAVEASPGGDHVVAVGRSCGIALSGDGGLTFSDVSCGADTFLAAAAWTSDDEVLLGGEGGVVLRLGR